MRYAQRRAGQKLHVVTEHEDGFRAPRVSQRALCGRTGPWRMTINVPLAHACQNCQRALRARRSKEDKP